MMQGSGWELLILGVVWVVSVGLILRRIWRLFFVKKGSGCICPNKSCSNRFPVAPKMGDRCGGEARVIPIVLTDGKNM
ncbi:MAG: hypothetical protein HW380_2607 [Magnetococcales bacterium]|nr:hypothetical protein [Magnetococcales bacterium]